MSLAGDLEVQLIDSFVPQVGDIFSLFNLAPSTNLLGGFSDILLPELASGVWDLTDLYTTGELLVATSPVTPGPGDLNMDGTVDGLDFLEWQRTGGTPAGLTAWQTNYGITSLLAAASTAVPEPTSVTLWLLGLVVGSSLSLRRTTS